VGHKQIGASQQLQHGIWGSRSRHLHAAQECVQYTTGQDQLHKADTCRLKPCSIPEHGWKCVETSKPVLQCIFHWQ
jgi:hypothetical protein